MRKTLLATAAMAACPEPARRQSQLDHTVGMADRVLESQSDNLSR